ncbi:MAG: isochorismatase family protein [Chloroflexi bacterium]|nr:isochorismatase family protein [Chloroflexota bacterium]
MTKRVWDDVVTERDKQVYALGGFASKGGLGDRPAVIVIDVMYHSVGDKPEPILDSVKKYPASCGDEGWQAVYRIRELLERARAAGVPVIYVKGTDKTAADFGRYADKMPGLTVRGSVGTHDSRDIVEEIAPMPGDPIVRKPKSSAFFRTNLPELLEELGVDTLLIAGCTTSGCVRLTAADAFQHDIKTAVIEECVYDRGQASHAVNLWDMNAKYADVISLEDVTAYLARIPSAARR